MPAFGFASRMPAPVPVVPLFVTTFFVNVLS